MALNFRYPDKPIETGPTVVKTMPVSHWIAQHKYDGWNLSIYIDGPENIRCLTSNGNPIKEQTKFDPVFVKELQELRLPPDSVLNAEFVGPRGKHSPAIYIFDMLAWAGKWLTNESYQQRWNRCVQLPLGKHIYLATTIQEGFIDEFIRLKTAWITNGKGMDLTEGIVLKSRNGTMRLGINRCQKSNVLFKLKYRDVKSSIY